MLDKKSFQIKGGSVDIMLVGQDGGKEEYFIVADSDGQQVGYCAFKLNKRSADLSRIVVTDPDFLNRGVGHTMMYCMEQFCHRQGITDIHGYYVPRVYKNADEITSKFYSRHNFIGDGYEGEYFDRDEIFANVHDRGEEYLLTPIYDEELYNRIYDYNYNSCDLFSSGPKEKFSLEI